jgi:hypothetical protein
MRFHSQRSESQFCRGHFPFVVPVVPLWLLSAGDRNKTTTAQRARRLRATALVQLGVGSYG